MSATTSTGKLIAENTLDMNMERNSNSWSQNEDTQFGPSPLHDNIK
jgi:hypothetical protein